jgi:hypothetical protein
MSLMVNLNCVSCGEISGEASVYDLPFISDNTCWACADESEHAEYLNWLENK